MIHKKPTGRIGPIKLEKALNTATLSWETISFPQNKDEIEQYVMQQFVAELQKEGASFLSVNQNPENHFDFTLELTGGRVFMDLTELMYRDTDGNPYQSENSFIKTHSYAEQIINSIMSKSRKYTSKSTVPIHLLTYITHWRFVTNEKVIRLIQHGLRQNEHVFENVFFLQPLDASEATLRVLFPSADELFENFDPGSLRDHEYLNLDPGNFKLVTLPTS